MSGLDLKRLIGVFDGLIVASGLITLTKGIEKQKYRDIARRCNWILHRCTLS